MNNGAQRKEISRVSTFKNTLQDQSARNELLSEMGDFHYSFEDDKEKMSVTDLMLSSISICRHLNSQTHPG